MGIVYLPKMTPSVGQKGFKCGNIFVPVKDLVFPPASGLIFHFTGETSSAETGQSATTETGEIQYGQTVNGIPCVSFSQGASLLFPDIGLTGSFDTTISAWVNFSQSPTYGWVLVAGWGRRSESTPPTTKSSNNDIGFMNGADTSLLNLRYKAGWSCGSQTLLDTIQTGTWYHMVMTVEKNTKTAKAFLNGSFVGSKSFDEFDIESSIFCINHTPGSTQSNSCKVAGVRVYNRILSDSELNILYNEFSGNSVGKKGVCLNLDSSSKKAFIPLEEVSPLSETNVEIGTEGILIKGVSSNIFIPVLENTQISGGN